MEFHPHRSAPSKAKKEKEWGFVLNVSLFSLLFLWLAISDSIFFLYLHHQHHKLFTPSLLCPSRLHVVFDIFFLVYLSISYTYLAVSNACPTWTHIWHEYMSVGIWIWVAHGRHDPTQLMDPWREREVNFYNWLIVFLK